MFRQAMIFPSKVQRKISYFQQSGSIEKVSIKRKGLNKDRREKDVTVMFLQAMIFASKLHRTIIYFQTEGGPLELLNNDTCYS